MNTYTMIFNTTFDKNDFISSTKYCKWFKVVAELDRRTINIKFRKGTKAQKIYNLCNIWNADIYGLTTY